MLVYNEFVGNAILNQVSFPNSVDPSDKSLLSA